MPSATSAASSGFCSCPCAPAPILTAMIAAETSARERERTVIKCLRMLGMKPVYIPDEFQNGPKVTAALPFLGGFVLLLCSWYSNPLSHIIVCYLPGSAASFQEADCSANERIGKR